MSGSIQTIPFQPVAGQIFTFQARLLGATNNVQSTGTTFTINIKWTTFGQHWLVEVVDQSGNRVVTKPLIASPKEINYPINILAGYFSSSMTYLQETSVITVIT